MATNDEIRLKLTVSKMNVHRSTRLETIAAQSIVRNIDSFLDPLHSETRNARLLPIALRNIVLQLWLMRQFAELQKPQIGSLSYHDRVATWEKGMNVFRNLVSCHTLEADLNPFIKGGLNFWVSEHLLLEYLNLIGAKATNLKVLILSSETYHQNIWQQWQLKRTWCNAIGKFRNLITLNIWNIDINYTNLKEMCKNLKSLTHLSTRIKFDPSFDESNEREIEELQIFSNLIVFETDGQNKMFTLNCIQHLPKLQYIDYCATSIVEKLLDRCPDQKFALTHMVLTKPSNKEIHLNFPDMNDLEVPYCNNGDFFTPNSLPKFSKIKKLSIPHFASLDTMIRFLDAYGHGLKSLRIDRISDEFKLSSILDRCPKLQNLSLRSFSMLPEYSETDIHSFSPGLIEFELQYPSDDEEQILLDILSVPTLECVTLEMSCENFHLEDFEKLTAMIESRQVLGNLRRLKIFGYNMERDINHRVFRALSDFIKSASAFLPHLTDLESNIPSSVQVEINSEASLEVATLQKYIDVYEN